MTTPNKPSTAKNPQQQQLYLIGGIVAAAVVITLLAIIISSGGSIASDTAKLANVEKTRTADGAFVLGDPNAPVTIVEFADWYCPACQTFKPTVNRIIDEYVITGKAKLEYRTLMTAGGEVTGFAAQLAECAEAQRPGAFWDAYELLFDYASRGGANYNKNMSRTFAEDLDLDLAQLLACVPTATQVTTDQNAARQWGISSTPGVLIRYGNGAPQEIGDRRFDVIAGLIDAGQTN